MITPSHARSPSHAGASELPPRFTQVRQIANVVAPPAVSSQQSPHTLRRQRAHGPAASRALHNAQRVTGGSPDDIKELMTSRAVRSSVPK
jgi:hypothetical protein